MHAGQLQHKVTFQQPAGGVDDFGQPIPGGFADVAAVFAAIRPTGSSERLAASQMQSGQTHVITVRHAASIAAATGAWRIVYKARHFGIVGRPRTPDEAGRWLVFDCVEKVNG